MNSKQLQGKAKEAMKGQWKYGTFAVLVLWIISTVFEAPEFVRQTPWEWVWFFGATALIVGPVFTGMSWMFLEIWDRRTVKYGSLFDMRGKYLKVVAVTFIVYLLTSIGLILFVLPGIFIGLALSQAVFLLREHPDSSVWECLVGSFHRMKGHKLALLGLLLRHLLYLLPAVLAFLAGVWLIGPTMAGSWLVLGSIAYVLVIAFYAVPIWATSLAGFYREVIAK